MTKETLIKLLQDSDRSTVLLRLWTAGDEWPVDYDLAVMIDSVDKDIIYVQRGYTVKIH